MLDTSNIKAVLFDMDGTLADTDDAYIARVAQLMSPLHFAFPERNPTRFLRWGLMKTETPLNWLMTVPDQLGIDRALASFTDGLHHLRGERHPANFMLIEGVDSMLDLLAACYPLALVTSRDKRGVEAFLEQFKLRDYFKVVVSSLTVNRIKPHPAPVLYAADKLGIPTANCLMVGDTTVDIFAGNRAGAQTTGVLCGFGERKELELAGANHILERTPLLADLLRGAKTA